MWCVDAIMLVRTCGVSCGVYNACTYVWCVMWCVDTIMHVRTCGVSCGVLTL